MVGKYYQEALDKIKRTDFSPDYWSSSYVEDRCGDEIDILQELIDRYKSIIGDYMSYKDLKAEYEQKLAMYEKALDKACELLSLSMPYLPISKCPKDIDCFNAGHLKNKEEWIATCLDDEETLNDMDKKYASQDGRLSAHDLRGAIDRITKEIINNFKSYTLGIGEGVDNFEPLYEMDEQYRKLVDSLEEQLKNE